MHPGPLRLREPPAAERARAPRDATSTPATGSGAGVHCAACGARLANAADACTRRGAHQHRLTNPAGITFDVLLYAPTPGCRARGPAVREHSWFPPAAWTFAVCGSCGVQVGWHFDGDGMAFTGLVRERISAGEPDARH